MKNKVISAVILALAILGGLFIVLMVVFAFDEAQDYQPQTAVPQYQQDKLTSVERQAFMRSCNPDGATEAYCQCAIDFLDSRYSPAKIAEMGYMVTDEYMPPEMWDAVEACLYTLDLDTN